MPNPDLTQQHLDAANAAVEFAVSVRKLHRRRSSKGDPKREADIKVAQQRIQAAMKPIRSEIARFPFKPLLEGDLDRQSIREASAWLQAERRQLWKMQKRRKRK